MELQILDWIQQMRTPVGDVWMVFISRLGNAGMIWILFTCLLLMIPRTRRWGAALAAALCVQAFALSGRLSQQDERRDHALLAAQNAADEQTAAAENDYYTASENAALQQAQAALQQFNADRDYGLSVAGLTGFLNGTPTLNWRNYQLNVSSAAANAQTRAYEQALERWKTSGYVRQGDAAILGVPAGTPTADVSYKNAALALQRWKNGYGG